MTNNKIDTKEVQEKALIYIYIHARAINEHFLSMKGLKFNSKNLYKQLKKLNNEAVFTASMINKDFSEDARTSGDFTNVQELTYVCMDAVIDNVESLISISNGIKK